MAAAVNPQHPHDAIVCEAKLRVAVLPQVAHA